MEISPSVSSSSGGNSTTPLRSVTFNVAVDKKPEQVRVSEHTSVKDHIKGLRVYRESICGEILQHSDVNANGSPAAFVWPSFDNGLVGGLVQAYNNHHHIHLRPDNFWVAILVQFGLYVNDNSEALRSKFVDFQGKKELEVVMGGTLRTAEYDVFARLMTEQVSKNLKDASVRDWIIPSFTTTTESDKVVYSVVMMSALKSYFDYKCTLMCGIPSVTLWGTPEDYEDLAHRVDRLLTYDTDTGYMKKWHGYLKPVMDELVRASRGTPNPEFWSRVCTHLGGGSGPSYYTGWISAFCCFDEKGKWQGDRLTYSHWSNRKKVLQLDWPCIDSNDVPPGFCTVPVLVDDNGTKYKTQMIAGSFAVSAINGDTLMPRLDWAIAVEDGAKIQERHNAQHRMWDDSGDDE